MGRRNREPKEILPNSSYYKVLSVLAEFPESKEIPKLLTQRVGTARIKSYSFSVNTWNATTSHSFIFEMEVARITGPNISDIPSMGSKSIVEGTSKEHLRQTLRESIEESCKGIIRAHFGQKNCPTYNCKASKIDLTKYLFDRWYQDGGNQDLCDASARLETEMEHLVTTEAFKKKERAALSREAIEDIKKSLRKFKEVSEEVVHEAVNEYLCERVVDG